MYCDENDEADKKNQIESVTKYGEQIPSLFSWMSIEEQKSRAKRIANITKKTHKKNI